MFLRSFDYFQFFRFFRFLRSAERAALITLASCSVDVNFLVLKVKYLYCERSGFSKFHQIQVEEKATEILNGIPWKIPREHANALLIEEKIANETYASVSCDVISFHFKLLASLTLILDSVMIEVLLEVFLRASDEFVQLFRQLKETTVVLWIRSIISKRLFFLLSSVRAIHLFKLATPFSNYASVSSTFRLIARN